MFNAKAPNVTDYESQMGEIFERCVLAPAATDSGIIKMPTGTQLRTVTTR